MLISRTYKGTQLKMSEGNKLVYTFDIKEYLDDRGVTYSESGKNVTEGWLNISCPFCDDHSNHLGIDPTTMKMSCWRCGPQGTILNLIREIEGCSYKEAKAIVELFQTSIPYYTKNSIERRVIEGNILPKQAEELKRIHKEYLINRGFAPDYLIEKYQLKACYTIGDYKYSIIVPVIMNGRIVNFTAMSIGQGKRYKHCSNEKAIIPMKECIYNIDSVRDTALVVEGVTDVWRIGDGAVAVMGMEYTKEQILAIYNSGVRKAVIMFDAGELEKKKGSKLANALSVLIPIVEIIELESGDPGDFTEKEVKNIREIVFGS